MALKRLALGLGLIMLGAVAGIALVRELKPSVPSAAVAFTAGLGMDDHHSALALTPEEEAYAAELWPIHSEVKLSAVRMIFAGIAYKTEDHDAYKLRSKVQPLTRVFQSAADRARQLHPPPSLKDAHRDYLQALDLYAFASREMIKVAKGSREAHLLAAHRRSEEASTVLIKLSDTLWPGEYKPN